MFRFNRLLQLRNSSSRQLHSTTLRSAYIPGVVVQDGRGERFYDVFSHLLKERIICLFGGIDSAVSSVIVAQLLHLQSENKKKPIHMYINSPGGMVTSGLAIYDTMQSIHTPVATWCVGEACSMGALLLAGGTSGLRHALPHSRIMLHQPHGGVQGQATDIDLQVKEMLRLKKITNTIISSHTKQDLQTVEGALERDNFMSPTEAKAFGVIDHVLPTVPI